MTDHGCTCDVRPPRREFAHGGIYGRAVYVDEVHDDTRFAAACPYHGAGGSMVVRVNGDSCSLGAGR